MSADRIIDLFFSFDGRISRLQFFCALIALMLIHLGVGFQIDPNYFTVETPVRPTLGGLIWALAMCIPETAIGIKRLNDRNWPWWLGYALAIAAISLTIGEYYGYFLDIDGQIDIQSIYFWTILALCLLFLCDNLLMRGTRGKNHYGPDPLNPV